MYFQEKEEVKVKWANCAIVNKNVYKLIKTPWITSVSVRILFKTVYTHPNLTAHHIFDIIDTAFIRNATDRSTGHKLSLKIKGLFRCSPSYNKEPAQRQEIEMNKKKTCL